jgi:Mg/Co/Ni transporter MgtE
MGEIKMDSYLKVIMQGMTVGFITGISVFILNWGVRLVYGIIGIAGK